MGEASTQVVMEVLKRFGIECTEDQEQAVREAALEQTAHYLDETERFRHEEFVTPIMEIVQHLPKEELADMAEALVSPHFSPGAVMIAEDFGPVYTGPKDPRGRGQRSPPSARSSTSRSN